MRQASFVIGMVVAAGLSCALPAQAQLIVDTSASLGALRYTLEDLDPNDGIAPGLVISGSSLGAYFREGAPSLDPSVQLKLKGVEVGAGLFDAASAVSLTNARLNASASIDQGVLSTRSVLRGEDALVHFSGSGKSVPYTQPINGVRSNYLASYDAYDDSKVVLGTNASAGTPPTLGQVSPLHFSLTPNTRLVVQGDAGADLTLNPRREWALLDGFVARMQADRMVDYRLFSTYTYLFADSQVALSLSAAAGGVLAQDSLSISQDAGSAGASAHRTLQLTFDNLSTAAADLVLNAELGSRSLYAFTSSAVAIVPEVSSLHMMLLGSLGLCLVGSTRKPKSGS
jgi:hypothetical protein